MKNINLANLIAQFNLVHDKIKHSFNSVISVISFKLDLFLVKFNFLQKLILQGSISIRILHIFIL